MTDDIPPEKRGKGRPSKFSEAFAQIICELLEKGKTEEQVCDLVGISRSTLLIWKNKDVKFRVTVQQAKEIADDMVEAALFKRAVGYSHDAVKILSDGAGRIHEVPYLEHYPPEVKAAEFWLKNRRPDTWRDKQEIEHSNPDGKFSPVVQITIPDNGRDKK